MMPFPFLAFAPPAPLLAAWESLRLWLDQNGTLVLWISVASALLCLGSIALLPLIAARLPVDYLLRLGEGRAADESPRHWSVTVARNLGGGLLVLAGLLLVPLPGPGVMVILVGLGLMDFPAKRRLMLHLVRRPSVLDPLNRLRRIFGQPDLLDAPPAPTPADKQRFTPESTR